MPRLSAEPEIVKFVRVESVPYEHEWDPGAYDPYRAKQVMHDYIEEAVEAERLGWDGYFATEHHFDGWTLVPQPNIFLPSSFYPVKQIVGCEAVQDFKFHCCPDDCHS